MRDCSIRRPQPELLYLGGNIAENAGGPHGVKYGVTKDYVLGLEVVIPSGDVVAWAQADQECDRV